MIVTLAKWEEVRHLFTEDEKDKLNAAIVGETVCPRGVVVNEKRLPAAILEKLPRGSA